MTTPPRRWPARAALAATVALAVTLAPAARAQPTLRGATLWQSDQNGNNDLRGDRQFRGAWRSTQGVQNQFAGFFLTNRPDAQYSTANVYPNAPNVAVTLANGDNTFYFYASGVDRGNPGQFWGLNLWLAGAPESNCALAPSISAAVLPGTVQTALAAGGSSTVTQCTPPNSWTAGANTLSFTSGQFFVQLADLRVLVAGDGANPPDRVSQTGVGPDGIGDTYGTFTLRVSSQAVVPEPSTWALLGGGLGALGVTASRRRGRGA